MLIQFTLTIWLLVMLTTEYKKEPIFCALQGKGDLYLKGRLFGIVFRFIVIFALLYYGGFYQ